VINTSLNKEYGFPINHLTELIMIQRYSVERNGGNESMGRKSPLQKFPYGIKEKCLMNK